MPEAAEPDLAEISARFAHLLHAAGVAVSPERAGRWASAIRLARPGRRGELYWLGRVTLTLDRAEIETYDAVFASVFGGLSDVADWRGATPPAPETSPGRRIEPPTTAPDRAESGAAPEPRAVPIGERSVDRADDERSDAGRVAPATADELLRRRDFADCTPTELDRLRRIVATMQVSPPLRDSRRQRRHRSGRSIDRRATMRRARRTGGEPFELRLRRPTARRRRVVLIADVSGSMESYGRAYLFLMHGSVKALRAEVFVFATRLTRLTRQLRGSLSDPEQALRSAVADVEDWSGGTRIGESLRAFNDGWGRRGLARGAVAVIVSDGWESGAPDELGEQMARLARLAHRVVWVNPRAQDARFRPLTGGMAAALPHIDQLVSGHSLEAFDEVLCAISGTERPGR
jgi:uncharacterized protein with von Willebrand factor type A (vWA) domain